MGSRDLLLFIFLLFLTVIFFFFLIFFFLALCLRLSIDIGRWSRSWWRHPYLLQLLLWLSLLLNNWSTDWCRRSRSYRNLPRQPWWLLAYWASNRRSKLLLDGWPEWVCLTSWRCGSLLGLNWRDRLWLDNWSLLLLRRYLLLRVGRLLFYLLDRLLLRLLLFDCSD